MAPRDGAGPLVTADVNTIIGFHKTYIVQQTRTHQSLPATVTKRPSLPGPTLGARGRPAHRPGVPIEVNRSDRVVELGLEAASKARGRGGCGDLGHTVTGF